ncbi:MAG: septum formation initiator family protein [Pseudomonadota bacterium]
MGALRFKILPLLLLALFGFLQYRLWFESGGLIDMFRMKQQLAVQQAQNDKLKKRNDRMVRQLQYLQANSDGIEARARGELGMIKEGETFYQVVK